MERWNKVGVAFAAVGTAVVVLQFFGLQPSKSAVNGIHFESVFVAIMMVATWGAVYLGYRNRTESPLERFNGYLRWREGRLKQVAGREFRNQEVSLDGIEYIDCKFDGVTFVYNGNGKTGISSSIILAKPDGKPNAQFRTDNPVVGSSALIFEALGFFREDAKRRIESVPLDRQ